MTLPRWMLEPFWAAPLSRRASRAVMSLLLAIMAALVFARLGAPALWDDEANTALYGEAVWRTGDTSAVHGHNVIAYRDGVELDAGLRNRLVPPLGYIVEAPFVRETASAWWARLPFALAGLAAIALLLHWLRTTDASRRTWALCAFALVGNVSLVLYCKQARYYGLALLLTTAIAYTYAHRDRGRGMWLALAASAGALLATHYLCYAGVMAALAVDYALWGRRTAPLSRRALALIAGSQLAIGIPVIAVWFPLGKEIAAQHAGGWSLAHLELWLKTLRELDHTELGVGVLMLAAPLLARRAGDALLHRLALAILVATAVVTAFSPQPASTLVADVRYVSFLLPACVLLSVRALEALRLRGALCIAAGIVVFGTTTAHWLLAQALAPGSRTVPLRSTLVAYLGELADPPPSPYAIAAAWIDSHTEDGQTAIVLPEFARYPLMVHAPRLVYGWQLGERRAAQLAPLPPIQIVGKVAPDWVIAFGGTPFEHSPLEAALARGGAHYERAAALPITGVDQSRPELYWHRFDRSGSYVPGAELVFWRRTTSESGPSSP